MEQAPDEKHTRSLLCEVGAGLMSLESMIAAIGTMVLPSRWSLIFCGRGRECASRSEHQAILRGGKDKFLEPTPTRSNFFFLIQHTQRDSNSIGGGLLSRS